VVILCQSATPVLTRGGFNPPKRKLEKSYHKSRQKQTHANKHESWTRQKQTDKEDESLKTQKQNQNRFSRETDGPMTSPESP
jgi:hypothetical protein